MTAIRCIVSGHVQGVFFRASTRQVADSLGLAGHAINLPDGRVEVLASGAMESLERLKDYIRTGPSGASVTSVTCEPWDGPVPDSFKIG